MHKKSSLSSNSRPRIQLRTINDDGTVQTASRGSSSISSFLSSSSAKISSRFFGHQSVTFPFMKEQAQKYHKFQSSPKELKQSCKLEDYLVKTAAIDTNITPVFIFFQTHFRVGSTVLSRLLTKLSEAHKFKFINGHERFQTTRKNLDHSEHILATISHHNCPSVDEPVLIMDHHSWINFTNEGLPQPNFITFIRNPIENYISEYYYCRYGTKAKPQYRTSECKTMSMKKLKFSPDQCIKEYVKYGENCIQCHNIQYFERLCGTTRECQMLKDMQRGDNLEILSDKDLQIVELTKNRIAKNFHFIGFLEYFDESLLALEMIAPGFFSRAREVYESLDPRNLKTRSVANHKIDTSILKEDTTRLLEDIFQQEIDVYKFTEQLFFTKLNALGIDTSNLKKVRFLRDGKTSSVGMESKQHDNIFVPNKNFLANREGHFHSQGSPPVQEKVVDIPQMVMSREVA